MSLVSDFGPNDGVAYMLTGDKHAALLVVSLMTLRQHYRGHVQLICGDDLSSRIAARVIDSDELSGDGISVTNWQAPVGGGKGLQHANKCRVFDLSCFQRTVFLDADTTVHGPINELLPSEFNEEVRLTQFADWVSSGRIISKRIEQYRGVLPEQVAVLQSAKYPAINTGVFGFSKLSGRFFAEQAAVCKRLPVFMADELAAQCLYIKYPHVIFDDRWNWSPVHSGRPFSEARVVHYHGSGHCRIGKGIGHGIWLPLFMGAYSRNVAGIQDWAPASDKHLARWMKLNKVPA